MSGTFGDFEALRTSTGDGSPDKRFPMTGKGGSFRFAWGRPGIRSSYWKVDARPTGDIYVFERSLPHEMKVSLHQSGEWHVAYMRQGGVFSQAAQDYIAKTGSIRLDEWSRPEPDGPVTEALAIAVTADDIQHASTTEPEPRKPDVTWLDPPEPGSASYVTIKIVTPAQPFEQVDVQVEAAFGMRSGEAMMITSSVEPFDEVMADRTEKRRRWMTDDLTDELWGQLAPEGVLRQLYFHKASPTRREIWDMAFQHSLDVVRVAPESS